MVWLVIAAAPGNGLPDPGNGAAGQHDAGRWPGRGQRAVWPDDRDVVEEETTVLRVVSDASLNDGLESRAITPACASRTIGAGAPSGLALVGLL